MIPFREAIKVGKTSKGVRTFYRHCMLFLKINSNESENIIWRLLLPRFYRMLTVCGQKNTDLIYFDSIFPHYDNSSCIASIQSQILDCELNKPVGILQSLRMQMPTLCLVTRQSCGKCKRERAQLAFSPLYTVIMTCFLILFGA